MRSESRAVRQEINRLTKAISDEEQTINAIFQRMGQTYFAAHRSDPEEAQAANVQAILEAVERGKRYKEQINSLRGIAVCPQCSAEVSVTAAFCSRCGARLPVRTPPAPPAEPGTPVCPNCGNRCAPGQRFCNRCGTRLPEAAPVPTPGFVPQEPFGAASPLRREEACHAERSEESVPSAAPVPLAATPAPDGDEAAKREIPPEVRAMEADLRDLPIPEAAPIPEPMPIPEAAPIPEPKPISAPVFTPEAVPVPEPVFGGPAPGPQDPPAPKRRCARCGAEAEDHYRFCLECGAPL